jgi:hypothetical protein
VPTKKQPPPEPVERTPEELAAMHEQFLIDVKQYRETVAVYEQSKVLLDELRTRIVAYLHDLGLHGYHL